MRVPDVAARSACRAGIPLLVATAARKRALWRQTRPKISESRATLASGGGPRLASALPEGLAATLPLDAVTAALPYKCPRLQHTAHQHKKRCPKTSQHESTMLHSSTALAPHQIPGVRRRARPRQVRVGGLWFGRHWFIGALLRAALPELGGQLPPGPRRRLAAALDEGVLGEYFRRV